MIKSLQKNVVDPPGVELTRIQLSHWGGLARNWQLPLAKTVHLQCSYLSPRKSIFYKTACVHSRAPVCASAQSHQSLPICLRTNCILGYPEQALQSLCSDCTICILTWVFNGPTCNLVGNAVPSLICQLDLDLTDISYFWSTSHPDTSYQVSSQLAFRCRRRSKK